MKGLYEVLVTFQLMISVIEILKYHYISHMNQN